MVKKLSVALGLIVIAFLLIAASPKAGYRYVGSTNSDVFHHFSCQYAEKILPENAIYFVDGADARKKGYRPCKKCRPE